MFIPCRHIFAARQHLELPTFEASLVPHRLLKQYQIAVKGSCSEAINKNPDLQVSNFTRKELCTQKYDKMLSLCKRLSTSASLCGMPEFRKRYQSLEKILCDGEQDEYAKFYLYFNVHNSYAGVSK